MAAGFVFPPPPPPPPRATAPAVDGGSARYGYQQNTRGNAHFQARGRGRGRGSGSQNYRGGTRGSHDLGRPHQIHNRSGRGGGFTTSPAGLWNSTSQRPANNGNPSGSTKRSWSDANTRPKNQVPKGNAPPAVPSFGFDLSPLPRPTAMTIETTSPPRKRNKERTNNRLGLTLRSDEHEPSGEEDELDEEAQLAQAFRGDSGKTGLEFEYGGRVTNLSSPSEIAAWIAERKMKYPTKARIEQVEAEKKEAKEKTRLLKDQRKETGVEPKGRRTKKAKHEERKTRPPNASQPRQNGAPVKTDPGDSDVDRIQRKADELRRQLAAVEQELTLANAGVLNPQPRAARTNASEAKAGAALTGSGKGLSKTIGKDLLNEKVASGDGLYLDDQPITREALQRLAEKEAADDGGMDPGSDPELDLELRLGLEAEINNEDTSSSDASAASCSSDSGPEEQSSKTEICEGVETASPSKKSWPCRYFKQFGNCRLGERCSFSHETSGLRQKRDARAEKGKSESGRTTLYERLLKRQEEEENKELLQYVIALGSRGYFSTE